MAESLTKLRALQKKQETSLPPVPVAKVDYYRAGRRGFTSTLALPSSIVDNAQSLELKTYLVSQIAKAAATFCFNEIVIVSCDKTKQMKML